MIFLQVFGDIFGYFFGILKSVFEVEKLPDLTGSYATKHILKSINIKWPKIIFQNSDI